MCKIISDTIHSPFKYEIKNEEEGQSVRKLIKNHQIFLVFLIPGLLILAIFPAIFAPIVFCLLCNHYKNKNISNELKNQYSIKIESMIGSLTNEDDEVADFWTRKQICFLFSNENESQLARVGYGPFILERRDNMLIISFNEEGIFQDPMDLSDYKSIEDNIIWNSSKENIFWRNNFKFLNKKDKKECIRDLFNNLSHIWRNKKNKKEFFVQENKSFQVKSISINQFQIKLEVTIEETT